MLDELLRAFGVPLLKNRQDRAEQSVGVRAPLPRERQGGGDIFVGGGFDDILPRSAMSEYVKDYAAQTGRPTQYVPNARVGQVVNAIRDANRSGGPVNVVGHSYGGPDAYNAVAIANRQGLHIDNLITLDPVSGPIGRVVGPAHPDTWVNVHAEPRRPDNSDRITSIWGVSHKPSNLPVQQAEQTQAALNHRDVEGMMQQSGARARLDLSRQVQEEAADAFGRPQTAQDLHDNMPMMEWIRRRQADARGSR
jgi:thioesterase domain-containing protein